MGARYQPYPEYKDSGIEWLGEIPSHWKTGALSHLFVIKAGGDVKPEFFSDTKSENYPYPIYTNANDEKSVYGYTSKYNFSPNTITVSGRGEVGFAVFRDHAYDAIIRLLVLSPIENIDCKFVAYSINEVIDFRVESSAIGQLSTQQISPYKVAIPSWEEQQKISTFLDHETAKIDTLIDKQQQLIKLLKEKRQAVISHAVTKGLNPDVPMKDSGVEWLGEVPEGWVVTRLKYECTDIVDCLHSTPVYYSEGEYSAIRTADVHLGYLDVINSRKVTEETYNSRNIRLVPRMNDIIYSREGERFGIGAIIPENAKVCLGQRVMLFRTNITPKYLMWALNAESTYKQAQQDVIGSTSPHVNVDTIRNFALALPSEKEREQIAKYIDDITNSMDKVISVALLKISLLQERRAALISAAVTGKIDVRGWHR